VRPRSVSRLAAPFAVTLAAVVALAFAPSAGATVNVVPNPGFETGPCVGPPIATIICDWAPLVGIMSQDFVAPHSGAASMQLAGIGMNNVGATTINGVCIHLPRLMPAVGRVAGSSYSFLDRRAVRYWLQDVSTRGVRTWRGPVRAPAA